MTINTYTHLGLEDAMDEIRKLEAKRAQQEIEREKKVFGRGMSNIPDMDIS